jgi:hypothetical protein
MTSKITTAERAARRAEQQACVAEIMMARDGFVRTAEPRWERMPDGTRRKHQVAFVDGVDTGFSTAYALGSDRWEDARISRRIGGRLVEQPIPEGNDFMRHEMVLLAEVGFIPSKEERRRRIAEMEAGRRRSEGFERQRFDHGGGESRRLFRLRHHVTLSVPVTLA